MILALQGLMAVGKTTILKKLKEKRPDIDIVFEDIKEVLDQIKKTNLNKENLSDFIEIQRFFIHHEIIRYEKFKHQPLVIFDYGAEEILFHTLYYPISMGFDWDIEEVLKDEIKALMSIIPDHILYLDLSLDKLTQRKENDLTRARNSFDFYIKHFAPYKYEYLSRNFNLDRLDINDLSLDEVVKEVEKWIDSTYHIFKSQNE